MNENNKELIALCSDLAKSLGLQTKTGIAALVLALEAAYELDKAHSRLITLEDPKYRNIGTTQVATIVNAEDKLAKKQAPIHEAFVLQLIKDGTYTFDRI